jgi:hypothetical protein
MPQVKSSLLRPEAMVTYEPEPESMTSVAKRPMPRATWRVPNSASFDSDILGVMEWGRAPGLSSVKGVDLQADEAGALLL